MTSPFQTAVYVTYDGDRLSDATFYSLGEAHAWADVDRTILETLGWICGWDKSATADERPGVNRLPADARRV